MPTACFFVLFGSLEILFTLLSSVTWKSTIWDFNEELGNRSVRPRLGKGRREGKAGRKRWGSINRLWTSVAAPEEAQPCQESPRKCHGKPLGDAAATSSTCLTPRHHHPNGNFSQEKGGTKAPSSLSNIHTKGVRKTNLVQQSQREERWKSKGFTQGEFQHSQFQHSFQQGGKNNGEKLLSTLFFFWWKVEDLFEWSTSKKKTKIKSQFSLSEKCFSVKDSDL